MNRELLWFVLAIALFCAPAAAQQAKQVPRIGYLAAVSASADAPRLQAFRQGLRDLGYVEGQNIVVDYRHEDREFERLPRLAAELVGLKIDLLVAVTTNAALAAKQAAGTIPIVFMGVTDPISAGLAQTLARPGGNSTGITNMAAVLAGKRLELLKEMIPGVARVAVLWDPQAPGSIPQWKESQGRRGNCVCNSTRWRSARSSNTWRRSKARSRRAAARSGSR
jgi:putative ABC transport system substrate-binding protein